MSHEIVGDRVKVRPDCRYGINAFDTSAYYGPSEIVLGTALEALASEFPRSSYKLVMSTAIVSIAYANTFLRWTIKMTKCGRYGAAVADMDYAPNTVRASVERSLARLSTDYLDAVYLHDVEFVCTSVQPRQAGNHLSALTTEAKEYGLAEGQEAMVWGEGDRIILDAIAELRKMKKEGLVKHIGITGVVQAIPTTEGSMLIDR